MLDDNKKAELRVIIAKHIEAAVEEIADVDVGYWPGTNDAFVNAVMTVLDHQMSINDYHIENKTKFD